MSEPFTARFHDDEGWRCVLAREGRTNLHVTYISDAGIIHRTAPRDCLRFLQPLLLKAAPYPVDRMVRKFREVGRERGITEAAKAELARV
jgi:hypothetical protein